MTKPLITNLCDMVLDTRRLLGVATPAARGEWDTLRRRFPSNDDLRQGFISSSPEEIAETGLRLQRFRATLGPTSPTAAASPSA